MNRMAPERNKQGPEEFGSELEVTGDLRNRSKKSVKTV
jgi:hypothetical protein